MLKRISLLVSVAAIAFFIPFTMGVVSFLVQEASPQSYTPEIKPASNYGAIVRLKENGHFFCSAFIISDTQAITAAHCIYHDLFGYTVNKDSIEVANKNGHVVTTAKVKGFNSRVDFALIEGDFKNFDKLHLDFSKRVYQPIQVEACGYPQNSKEVACSKLLIVGTRYFQIKAKGELVFGGHSGGPVIDKETGLVLGVISAVDEDGILFTPVEPIKYKFGL